MSESEDEERVPELDVQYRRFAAEPQRAVPVVKSGSLTATAKTAPKGTGRVVFTASGAKVCPQQATSVRNVTVETIGRGNKIVSETVQRPGSAPRAPASVDWSRHINDENEDNMRRTLVRNAMTATKSTSNARICFVATPAVLSYYDVALHEERSASLTVTNTSVGI